MDSSAILNIVAVAVAFSALTVSLVFAVRQTHIMRQANQLPIFIDMIREFRSKDFQRAEEYILTTLRKENAPDKGVLGLTGEARLAATAVQSFFGVLANLVMEGIISEGQAVSTLGFRGDKLWRELEDFIISERRLRGDNDYARYFEDFVSRVRDNWPPEERYGIPTRRLKGLGGTMARTPSEVLQHHVRALGAGDLTEIIADYADDAFFITPSGVVHGKDGIRAAFTQLLADVPDAAWEVRNQVCNGDVLLLEWCADSAVSFVEDGIDTYVFNSGLIRVQTTCYTLQRKC